MSAPALKSTAARIDSMDQFRGYTVAGMFLVNFIGGFAAVHPDLQAPQHLLQLRRHDHAAVLLRGRLRAPAGAPAEHREARRRARRTARR